MYIGIQISDVFFPRLSQMNKGMDGRQKMSDLLISVGRHSLFLLLAIVICFIVLEKEFLYLWIGEGYEMAYYVAVIVMIPFTIDLIQHLALSIMQVTNQYKFRANMYLLAALINIASTVVLTKYLGGIGAALSTGISMIITSGIILNLYLWKKVKLDIPLFWKNISQILARSVPYGIIFYIVNLFISTRYSLLFFVSKIFVFLTIYCFFCWRYLFNSNEKRFFIDLFQKK